MHMSSIGDEEKTCFNPDTSIQKMGTSGVLDSCKFQFKLSVGHAFYSTLLFHS